MARTAERTITLVLDPEDDAEHLTQLRSLHARPFGQVVCEPIPGAGSNGLARSLLAALGKNSGASGPCRDPLWRLVGANLRAQRVHDLIVLRGHTVTYPALRRLAEHTIASHVHTWLVVHRERPPAAVAQLLESFSYDTAPLRSLLEYAPILTGSEPDETSAPAGAGPRFPHLEPIAGFFAEPVRRLPRESIVHDLSSEEGAAVHDAWDGAHAWIGQWLEQHAAASRLEAADAVYLLARRGHTASEIYVRIRAALEAFLDAGVEVDVALVDGIFARRFSFSERRPFQFNRDIAHAAALADEASSPELAALIAVAAVCRCTAYLRYANRQGLASDGSAIAGPWGGVLAIPPELRCFLASWHQELAPVAGEPARPLFPGSSYGRRAQPAIRRVLAALDAPAGLWEDPADTHIANGASSDGRALLHHLNPWHLCPGEEGSI